MRQERGFTLVEILIALVLTTDKTVTAPVFLNSLQSAGAEASGPSKRTSTRASRASAPSSSTSAPPRLRSRRRARRGSDSPGRDQTVAFAPILAG